jgi:bZIP transcription factor
MNFFPSCLTKDEKEIKKEKRKQSNRESARRSRLRKQVLFIVRTNLAKISTDRFLLVEINIGKISKKVIF